MAMPMNVKPSVGPTFLSIVCWVSSGTEPRSRIAGAS